MRMCRKLEKKNSMQQKAHTKLLRVLAKKRTESIINPTMIGKVQLQIFEGYRIISKVKPQNLFQQFRKILQILLKFYCFYSN